jgi:hypothetical protein
MKVEIKGDTPMERLTNFTKRVVAVGKSEVAALEKKWDARKRPKRSAKRR